MCVHILVTVGLGWPQVMGRAEGFLTFHLVFRQSLLFTTACTGRPGLCSHGIFLFPPPILLSEHWDCRHTALSGFYMGSGASNAAPLPQPPPRVCPVSTFPTEPSLQSRGRIFVDKIQQKD